MAQSGKMLLVDVPVEIKDDASLDLAAVLESLQAISGEIVLERLLVCLLRAIIHNSGAEEAFLLLEHAGELLIQASGTGAGDAITVLHEATPPTDEQLPTAIVNHVQRTREILALGDATRDPRFATSLYIARRRPKSVLCMPVLLHDRVMGILYLENNRTTDNFSPARIKTTRILVSQAAISLENARLYAEINRESQIRQRAEQVFRTITEATASVTGKDFFRSLLRHLTSAFDVREAFIAECTDHSMRRARKIVLIKDGKFQEQQEYELVGTPCEAVLRGEVRYYPKNLTRLFPKADGRESYLGAPLFDGAGKVLGHMVITSDRPMDLDPQDRAVFEIFAARAGVELERKKTEDTLRHSEHHLRQLNEQLEDYSHNLERRVAERTREIEQRRKVAESLRGLLAVLNSNRTGEELQSFIVSQANLLFGSDTSAIFHFDAQENLFRLESVHGRSANAREGWELPHRVGEAIKSLRPAAISSQDASVVRVTDDEPEDFGNHALLAVPLIVSGETYGCLALYYGTRRTFSQEEIAMALAFGDEAALAIENDRLRNLAKQATVIEERSRLARELHDSVTQSIYSLTLLAEGWQRMALNGELADVVSPLAELGQIAQQALKEMRLLIYELRPPALEQEGLLGALHLRLAAVEKRAGVDARLIAQDVLDLPAAIEEGLYRIAQEALNNSLKHAAATSVTVRLENSEHGLAMQIADNGRGFDTWASPNSSGGIGLTSMRERVERLGGSLQICSTPGSGTTVLVRLDSLEVSNE